MNFSHMISHEWKTRLGRPAGLVSLLLFSGLLIYGAISGRMERDSRLEAIATHEEQITSAMESWLNNARLLEEKGAEAGVPPWSGSALDVTFSSALPPGPLGDFAIGQSDILPSLGGLSLWSPDIRLFSKYEFEDPVALALGGLDLGKVVLLVLPLLLIVLSFDILSAERDSNRLGLTLAQGVKLRSLFWKRLSIRGGVILGLTFAIVLAAFLFQAGEAGLSERLPYFAIWGVAGFLYALFWIGVIAVIASGNRGGEVNVVLLLIAWAGFTLIVPASITAVAESVYPAPSRLAYLAEAREAENETRLREADIANQFIIDHPEMLVNEASEIPAFVRTAFLVTSTVDEATKPLLDAFEAEALRRDASLGWMRFLSPTIITHSLFNDVAGTDSSRHRRYMKAARTFKSAYGEKAGPYVVAGQRLPTTEFATLPAFRFEEESLGNLLGRHRGALIFLILASGLLLFFADRRLQAVRGPDE